MKYTVGKYVIVPPKPFYSIEEAVQYIQERYPELDNSTIEKHLTPKISNNGNDQPGNISEAGTVSNQDDTEAGTTGVKRVKSDPDKSRQPLKG